MPHIGPDNCPPTPPIKQKPNHDQPGPSRALSRLNELRQKTKMRALFGDSPPPSREHAPYPEGDIIHDLGGRFLVRHGSYVTKYTTSSTGLDGADHPNEALVMKFVKENTTIPVPDVISSDWDRLTMTYIEGQTLRKAWPTLTPTQRLDILGELRGYIEQMRAMGGIYLGRHDGQGVLVPSIFARSGGPFKTITELHDWLVRPHDGFEVQSMYWHQITTHLRGDASILFTHGDLAARNIQINDGHIVGILDWEFAGWYPEYWEYVFTLRGLDNIDWKTLGEQLPSLFPKRYDLEYILMQFILSIS